MQGLTFFLCASALVLKDAELKDRPVTKVINLLKDMQATLQKEQEQDEEIYDKLTCWCETNDKEKSRAVEIAQARITSLQSDIEELTGKSARLNTEISALNEEIAQNTEALDKATAIRTKELAEFNGEEKDMLQSIQALGNAITVLSKHNSLAQMPAEALVSVTAVIRHQISKHALTVHQKEAVQAFLQGGAKQPAGFQSYAPQSGQIFGILQQMKETFESNLSTAQKEELAAREAFAQLKAAKTAEIKAGQQSVDAKTAERADTDEKNAQAKQDLEDTRNALSADQKFLLDLKEKCRVTDAEWEERSKTRSEEIQAVSEAISILSDDDAHDLFSKTLGFPQVRAVSTREATVRGKAVAILKAAAAKSQSADLAGLAAEAQLDGFEKVKAAIDDMVAALTKQQADEVKHRDFCTAELAENQKQTMVSTDEKTDLEAHIADLGSQIETLTSDLANLKAEIQEMNVQVKRASEDREAENKEFQQTVADQRATQQILQKALDRLNQFYAEKALLQTKSRQEPEPGAAAPPPPPGFSEYKKSSGANGVIGMIREVINDAKAMERDALRAEQDSQSAYESFVKNTNNSIKANQRDIVNKTEDKAKAEKAKTQAEEDLKATMTDLESLAAYAADLHKSCDYVLDNFTVRQEARGQEIEALRQAKAVLSGADFQ